MLKQRIELYQNHGEEGLRKRYTNYSAEFKLDVLNFMDDTGASPYEAAAVYNIPSRDTVNKWKKAVDAGGMDALIPKKKERPAMKEKPKKMNHQSNRTKHSRKKLNGCAWRTRT